MRHGWQPGLRLEDSGSGDIVFQHRQIILLHENRTNIMAASTKKKAMKAMKAMKAKPLSKHGKRSMKKSGKKSRKMKTMKAKKA